MDLTDDDLERMASVMWRDLSPPALPSSADEKESPTEKEKSDANVSVSPEADASIVKIDRMKRPAKTATGESQNTNSGKARNRKRAPKKRASLFAELDVSSPDVSVRSKDIKLSKSMKGASQNESQIAKKAKLAEARNSRAEKEPIPALEQGTDLYSFPISPTSSGRIKKEILVEAKQAPSDKGKAKMSSPLAPGIQTHLNSLHEKFSKPQKRVAKRSFLDPPETPQPETKVKSQQNSEKAPSPKEPAVATTTKRQTRKPAPHPKAPSSFKPTEEISASDADATAKLRLRRERAPIVISSDPVSGGEEDGDTDFMEMGYMPDAGSSSLHSSGGRPQPLEKKRTNPPENKTDANGAEVHETPAVTVATSKTIQVTGRDNVKAEKPSSVRTTVAHTAGNTNKRSVAAMDMLKTDRQEKKTRLGSDNDNGKKERVQAESKTRSGTSQRKKPPVSAPSVAANDPFIADSRGTDLAQTQFTAKLLQSAGMGSQSAHVAPEATPHMQHVAPQVDAHEGMATSSMGQKAQQAQQAEQVQREKSDGIARQMMRLFADIDSVAAGGNRLQQHAERDLWLDETETYGETGQIMGYVCKTILRFLKSKEAAIEDVANEYHQRGAIVLARVESLHKTERYKLVQQFEQARLESLGVFDAASTDVQLLNEKLQHVRLAPVVNSVFADNAVSRLRALQAEVA